MDLKEGDKMLKFANDRDFDEILKNSKPLVMIDFFATWCGPCTKLHPVLEKLAAASDAYDIIKVDIDENPALAEKYSVSAVPTLLIIKDGKSIGRSEGYYDFETLKAKLDELS